MAEDSDEDLEAGENPPCFECGGTMTVTNWSAHSVTLKCRDCGHERILGLT